MNLQELRQKYPQYDDMEDQEFADAFHKKFYSDLPKEQFYSKIGFRTLPQEKQEGVGNRVVDWVKQDLAKASPSDLLSGAKASGKFLADMAAGVIKLPAAAAIAAGHKLVDPSTNLQENWQNAQQAVEDTYKSFGTGETNAAYTIPMKPFEMYGKGVEAVAKKAGELTNSPDVEGAVNILGNIAPIPGLHKAGKAASHWMENSGSGSKGPIRGERQSVASILEAEKAPEVLSKRPEQLELPLENSLQQLAEIQAREVGQRDLFGPLNEPVVPEAVIPERSPDIVEPIKEQQQLPFDTSPEEIAARQAETSPQMDMFAEDWQRQKQNDPYAVQQQLDRERQQSLIEPMRQEEAARPLVDEHLDAIKAEQQVAKRQQIEQAFEQRKQELFQEEQRKVAEDNADRLDTLEQQLREQAYVPPTQESLRAARGRPIKGPRSQRGGVDIQALKEVADKLGEKVNKIRESAMYKNLDFVKQMDLLLPVVRQHTEALENLNNARDAIISAGREKELTSLRDSLGNTTAEINRSKLTIVKNSQRGAIDIQSILESIPKVGNIFTGKKVVGGSNSASLPADLPRVSSPKPLQDTITKPTSAANIVQKQEVQGKLSALNLKDFPEYSRITTPQEAKAVYLRENTKDIPNNLVRNATASGVETVLRANSKNPILNYVRSSLQEARNAAEVFSKKYVTGPDGVVKAFRALSKEEWTRTTEAMLELSKRRIEATPELLDKLGLNEKQQKVVFAFADAFDSLANIADRVNESLGFQKLERLPGYSPANFPGSYRALVGSYRVNKDGTKVFSTRAVVNADTRGEYNLALKHYKDSGMEVVPLKKRTLNTKSFGGGMFDGFNDLVNRLAENDPEFAKLKAEGDAVVANKVKQLYSFNVHEMKKAGVQGSSGDKPWLSPEQNAKEYLESLINHLEEGAKYYNYQDALNGIGQLVNDPEIALPNTKAYVQEHARHITGQNLNPVGAGMNWVLDKTADIFGASFKVPQRWMNELSNVSALHMMGTYNPTFLAMQLTQFITGGVPEALKLGKATGLGAAEASKSLSLGGAWNSALMVEHLTKNSLGSIIPDHIREAEAWARTHGMFDFSEMELAHSALKNEKLVKAENIAALPMSLGERATRPGVFMGYVDLLHKAGLDGEEAFKVAQNATDFAMGNYHPDERPHMYAGLGVVGQGMGKLTTFKHNVVSQWMTRSIDAKNGKAVAPVAAMAAMSIALSGLAGLPGYDELDAIVEKLSGYRIRDLVLPKGQNPSAVIDGPLSYMTGFDFQSRLGMGRMVPDSAGAAFNPQLANIWNMTTKVYDYAKNQDQMSFNEMTKALTPQGMKGFVEDTNAQGQPTTKEGYSLFPTPRTETEQSIKKWFNVRPLRETTERSSIYTTNKRVAEQEKTQRDISKRMDAAISLGDWEGYSRLGAKYIENGGDPTTIYSQKKFEDVQKNKYLTERQRRGGIAPQSLSDLHKYQEYNK